MLLRVSLFVFTVLVYYDEVCGQFDFNEIMKMRMNHTKQNAFEDSYETEPGGWFGHNITMTLPYDKKCTLHYYGPKNSYKIPARAFVRHLSGNDTFEDEEPPSDKGLLRFYSQRYCAFAHRVHLILYAHNISHDTIYIDTSNKPKWFRDYYHPAKVPMIMHNNQPITDSMLICDYLDVKHPGPRSLLHKDVFYQNDDYIMVAEEFEKVAYALRDCLMCDTMSTKEYNNLTSALTYFEKELDKRGTTYWFGNEYPGMTDYLMWPWFERLSAISSHSRYVFQHPLVGFPKLLKWEENMLTDSAVKAHYQPAESYCEYFRRRRKRLPLFKPEF